MTKARGLQSYIFATNRLREVVGGSLLLESLLHELLQGTLEHKALSQSTDKPKIIQQAAGSAIVLFSQEEEANLFWNSWPLLVSEYAPGLEVQHWRSEPFEEGTLAEQINLGQKALGHQRNQLFPALPEVIPPLRRAQRTGLPATWRASIQQDEPLQYHDATTRRKTEMFYASKQKCTEHKTGILTLEPGTVLEQWQNKRWATQMEELAKESQKLAVVHADGNRVGRFFLALGDEIQKENREDQKIIELLHTVSTGLSQATQQAVCEALRSTYRGVVFNRSELPIRPVILGGDDLTILLQSKYAIQFTTHYLQHFEEATKNQVTKWKQDFPNFKRLWKQHPSFTACAGIFFQQRKQPLIEGVEGAELLCQWSKKYAKNQQGETLSALMFGRREGHSMQDFHIRHDENFIDPDSHLSLTAGPYLSADKPPKGEEKLTSQDLRHLANRIRELPKNSIRELLDTLHESIERTEQVYERMLLVDSGQEGTFLQRRLTEFYEKYTPTHLGAKEAQGENQSASSWPMHSYRNKEGPEARFHPLCLLPEACILLEEEVNL